MKIKTRLIVSMLIFSMLAITNMAQADSYPSWSFWFATFRTHTFPDNPIAGCVGFDGWSISNERTQGAIDMIKWVIQELVDMGICDEVILAIVGGQSSKLPF